MADEKWYLSVECKHPKCRQEVMFSPFDQDEVPAPPGPLCLPKTIQLRCTACGQEGVWTPADVTRHRAKDRLRSAVVTRGDQLIVYALYPPVERDMPWLAVVLEDGRLLEALSCPDREGAEKTLFEMKARNDIGKGRVSPWAPA